MTKLPQLRILLVDDSVVIRRSASMLLRALGLESIEVAEDGAVALGLLRADEKKFGLVLTDINMPNMNGFGLLQAIKGDESLKHLPVLMMSVDPRDGDRVLALEYGAVDLIAKPFTKVELVAAIRQALEGRATTA